MMKSSEPPVFSVHLEQGVRLPRIFPTEPNPYEQLNFCPANNDIVLCSYPASGEDTVLKILRELLSRKTSSAPRDVLHVTHLPFCRSRWNPGARYVLLLRNPKQVCVGFFYLFNKLFQCLYDRPPEENCSFNTFYHLFINGKVAFGDYFQHTRSWLERVCSRGCVCTEQAAVPDTQNLIVVIYEELENELEQNLRRLIQFFDVDVDVSEVLGEGTRAMRKQSLESADSNGERCRKKMGLAGGWESHFSKEHRIDFDKWVRSNGNAFVYNRFWFDTM